MRIVAPCVSFLKKQNNPQDVARALVDTLGALACSTADVPPSPGASSLTRTASICGGASEVFSLAVAELCAMCGGDKTDAGGWASLGLPLR